MLLFINNLKTKKMKKNYSGSTPLQIISFRLWVMNLAVHQRIKKQQNISKECVQLAICLEDFVVSLKRQHLYDEAIKAEKLLEELPKKEKKELIPSYIGPIQLKSWLIDVALDELRIHPNQKKTKTLIDWMNISKTTLTMNSSKTHIKYMEQINEAEMLLNM